MARLRESETRDDTSHASAVDQQLAEADDDLRDTLEARHSQPTEWVCPECGEQRRTHTGDDPEGSCFTCGDDETDWQRVVCDGGTEQSSDGTERIGPGWYVIERPHRDPARVVAGPKGRDAADSHARFLTTRAKIMHTPALVNAIKNEGYNVEWYEQAEKPCSLETETDHTEDSQ